jgi:hypothetical protein
MAIQHSSESHPKGEPYERNNKIGKIDFIPFKLAFYVPGEKVRLSLGKNQEIKRFWLYPSQHSGNSQ